MLLTLRQPLKVTSPGPCPGSELAPLRDLGSTHSAARAAREALKLSIRQNNKCKGLGFEDAVSHSPHPALNQHSFSGCKGACFPAISAPVPRANFLPPHTAAPKAQMEPSDLHLQRNKLNSSKHCLFFPSVCPRGTCCGSWDPKWVIQSALCGSGAGTSGIFTK